MSHRRITCLVLVLTGGLALSAGAGADTVKGRIDDISNKGSTIKLTPEGQPPVTVLFGPETQYVNAASVKDLGSPDLIEVEYAPGKPATRITQVVFGLPPGAEVSLQELEAIRPGLGAEPIAELAAANNRMRGFIADLLHYNVARDGELEDYVAQLAEWRAAHPELSDPAIRHDLHWQRLDGGAMAPEDWHDAAGFVMTLPEGAGIRIDRDARAVRFTG